MLSLLLLACSDSDYSVKALEPALTVAPAVIDFGAVPVGAFAEATTTLVNAGQAPLELDPPLAEGLASAELDTLTVAPGGAATLLLRWQAGAEGVASGVVTLSGNAETTGEVAWTGEGVVGSLTVDPGSLTFPSLLAGERSEQVLVLGNTGRADVHVDTLDLVAEPGFDAAPIGTTVPFTVVPGASVPIRVGFTAPSTARATGTLSVYSDDPRVPVIDVPLAANLAPANNRPAITLFNPSDGAVFSMDQAWTLRAYALDVETDPTDLVVTFSSDRQGVLGTATPDATGEALLDTVSTLEGADRITATVTDGDGASSSDSAAIEVTPCREYTWDRAETFGPEFDHTLFAVNGSATHDPTLGEFVLTDGTWQGGAIYLDAPIWLERFHMELQFRIDPLTGGDGLAVAWVQGADPSTFLGRQGEQLGVGAIAGVSGWVVEVDNHSNGSRGDPSADHVALVALPDFQHVGAPVPVMELEDGVSRRLVVDFNLGHLIVTLEGATVLETDVPLWAPFEGYLGVTAATGALSNRHVLEDWVVETGCW
jgi:hypothetical protein